MKLILKASDGAVHLIADSAIARSGQPWFMPDCGSVWTGSTALAVRIGRLGKGIARKFAMRYVDAVSMIWVADCADAPHIDFMDGRVVCGKWLDISEIEGSELDPLLDFLTETSQNATLKTGDIIAISSSSPAEVLKRNSRVQLALNQQTILSFNIK